MLYKNRRFFVLDFALILSLLGGMFGVRSVGASATTLPQFNTNSSAPQSDLAFPTVVTTSPQPGDVLSNNPSTITVEYSTKMLADGTAFSVNKPTNYLLVEDGPDGKFQTTSCTGQLAGDDTYVPINSVTYNSGNFTSTLTVSNWPLLNQASYQLLVCASTRIVDVAGNRLNDGSDSVIRFVLIKDVDLYPYANHGGGSGQGVGIGDFNHDGLTDIVMSTGSLVLVYLKNSDGSLNKPNPYLAGSRSEPLAAGDLNNDGWADVVTADFSSNTISVFLQQADGTLASRVTYATSTNPNAIAVGDISGDGLADVVISHSNAPYIGVFIQSTNGTLTPMVTYTSPDAGGDDIAIGDVNNDGRNDVVKMNGQGLDSDLYVYLQNMSGALDTAFQYSLGCVCIGGGIDIGDITGDGLSDVVMSYGGNRPNSKIAVFAQGQDGQLQPAVIYDAYDIPLPVEIADINLDGSLDVLVLHGGWQALGVFLQKDGSLQPEGLYTIPNINRYGPQALAVGDINQDGALDVAISDDIYGLTVLYHHEKPAPQVIMGGNTLPVDGEELGVEPSQLTVQFDRQMKADGSISAANSASNYLLVEDGVDNNFQTASCTGGLSGDDALISVDNVVYDSSKYFSTLSINGGIPLGLGSYRLFVCGTTSIEDVAGIKLNGGVSDGIITFAVWPTPHKISGNAGVGGAKLSYTDGDSRIVIADGSGDYSFKVSEHWTGTVTPSKANYTFAPASKNYADVSGDISNENYTATLVTFTISGNTGMSSVLLYYSPPGGYTSSDENGNYSLTAPVGWTGTVYASGVPGYRFIPESRSYSNLQADQSNQNFVPQRVYTISGNAGASGVTLGYVDGTPKTVLSSSNGSYSFQVPEHWSGTVTPSKSSHFFTPSSRTYNNVVADLLSQNYTSTVVVRNTNNSGSGSLRQAIVDADSGGRIYFDPTLAGQTITLASQLDINKNLTIDGSGLNPRVSISGNNAVRIFSIDHHNVVTLQSLILKNGKRSGTSFEYWGGAISTNVYSVLTVRDVRFVENTANRGGAVFVSSLADATILESEFVSNSAQDSGGGVYAKSDVTIKDSKFTSNSAAGGGAFAVDGLSMFVIENNTFTGNNASSNGGAIAIVQADNFYGTIKKNLFNSNTAGNGGAIYIFYFSSLPTLIENNTFYANQTSGIGGAILTEGNTEIRNNTFSNNQAARPGSDPGASLFLYGAYTTLYNNILANSMGGAECASQGFNVNLNGSHNLVEDASGPCATLPDTIVSDPMLGSLAENGGTTQTMALLPGSAAIDTGDSTSCPSTDQRGIVRPLGNGCDIGAYEYVPPPTPTATITSTPTATPSYSYNPLYLSLSSNQTIGGVASADEDILKFDGTSWSLFFDGSDVGVGSSDLFGFSIVDSNTILMAFSSAVTVNGLTINPQDVVRFESTSLGTNTAGAFHMYLDGSAVGLETTAEKLDAVGLLPDGRVLVSTTGNPAVTGVTGGKDEDVLAFNPTTGTWALYVDGSDVGLGETSGEDVDALDVVNGKVYLSTADNFSVNGVSGADEDVFVCNSFAPGETTSCSYSSALYFDGSTWNLSANDVDAFHFLSTSPPPTATFTPTATITPTRTPTLPASMFVQITKPNGGEVLTVGSTYRITWNSTSDIDKVSLGYKSCEGCLNTIVSSIPNVGYYDWTVNVGNTINTQFKIQIIGYDTGVGSVSDTSDNNFTVLQPTPTPTQTFTPTPTGTVPTLVTITATPTSTASQLLPDLTITSMRIELQKTSCLEPGDALGVRVWITNNGQVAAGSFDVNVNGVTQTVNGLGISETKTVFFPGASNPVTAVVDFPGTVTESNEDNNTRSEMLPVPTPPSPCQTVTPSPTLTPTIMPTFTNTPGGSDLIFANSFESGNFSGWTSSTIYLGDLSLSSAAGLVGGQGMQAVVDDLNTIYVNDDTPNAELRYRARFYFDPNSITMASGDAHFIFKGFAGTSTEVLRVELRNSAGIYEIRAALLNDGTTWTNTNWFTISDAPHFIELDWRAATAAGANDGGLTLWIDSAQQANLTGVDNDTRRIERVRLGALSSIDAGTNGTYFFDAFESRRQSYIGP